MPSRLSPHFRARRGLLVYQLVLILIVVVLLIVGLLFYARRNQTGTGTDAPPAAPADTAAAMQPVHPQAPTAVAVRE